MLWLCTLHFSTLRGDVQNVICIFNVIYNVLLMLISFDRRLEELVLNWDRLFEIKDVIFNVSLKIRSLILIAKDSHIFKQK